MNETTHRSWLFDGPLRGPALPSGRLARLWGWLLLSNGAEQRELLPLLELRPGENVLEVGHGPGLLAGWMIRQGARVQGVDPSSTMVRMARRRAPDGTFRTGTAEHTGQPDASADLVVSVNNVPMWSDLEAGLTEARRVLRPGGRLVVSWHGGTAPSRTVRELALPPDVLRRIHTAMTSVFGDADHRTLRRIEVLVARRPSDGDDPLPPPTHR